MRVLALLCCLWLMFVSPALASIHAYPETADRVMWRSLQTLRDEAGHAWQVVLFKWVNRGQVESIHLRLVGFPGAAALQHPRSLQITTGTGKVLEAADVFADSLLSPDLATHVGEYDVWDPLQQIQSDSPLRLALPLIEAPVELPVPPFSVREWRQLVDQ